jgi:hypothetical protein
MDAKKVWVQFDGADLSRQVPNHLVEPAPSEQDLIRKAMKSDVREVADAFWSGKTEKAWRLAVEWNERCCK